MARYLSIDIDTHGLLVVAGSSRGDKLSVERLIAATDLAQPLTAANAGLLGARLKALLKEANVAPAPALVVLGRDRIILKDVRHPPVPPADEPSVIRFAALKEIAEGAEDVLFDYTPLPTSLNSTEKRATVAFVKKDVIAAVRSMCDAAGLKLAAVTPRPYAAVAALAHAAVLGAAPPPEPADGPVAVVVAHDGGGEFTVCRNGVVTFTRTLAASATASEEALIAELRRDLAISSGQAGSDVEAIYVAEADSHGEGWSGRLRAALGLPVYAFDPLANVKAAEPIAAALHGRFLGAVGLLTARGQHEALAINFVQPRQPRNTESSPMKKKALVAALAAAVLVGVLGVGSFMLLDSADQKVINLRRQITSTEEQIKACEPDAKRLAAVNEYAAREVNWLDEYYEQAARFPDIKKVRMTHFQGDAVILPTDKERQAEAAKAAVRNGPLKKAASLSMTLTGENSALPEEMMASITRDSRYYPGAKMKTGSAIGGGGSSKVQPFVIDTGVAHRPPSEYAHKLNATMPKAVEAPKAEEDEAEKKEVAPLPNPAADEEVAEKPGETEP